MIDLDRHVNPDYMVPVMSQPIADNIDLDDIFWQMFHRVKNSYEKNGESA
jgi:hypothetical protein